MLSKTVKKCVFVTAIAALLLALIVIAAVVFQRNRWPASITQELAALRAKQVPVTLEEVDAHYLSLSTNKPAEALAHFNRAFNLIPGKRTPGFDRPLISGHKTAYLDFHPDMLFDTPELQKDARNLLEKNADFINLMHEGLKFETCHFPIKHADGWYAEISHIFFCRKAAAILAMEAVYRARQNDPQGAILAISASLHLAEIMKDEPIMISFLIRGQIVANVCHAMRACLNITPLPGDELLKINQRIMALLDRQEVRQMLIAERCLHLSIFRASNKAIALILDKEEPKASTRWRVEEMRWRGRLQRDCAFNLNCFAQVEQALETKSYGLLVGAVGSRWFEIELNKDLAEDYAAREHRVSERLLPGFYQAIERYLRELSLAEATATAIAVERFREHMGRLPKNLAELSPEFMPVKLPNMPEAFPLELRLEDGGYSIVNPKAPSVVLFSVKR